MTTSATRGHRLVVWTYLSNATLLCVHEIDSAYWHEWSLFGIPGGIQLFLILHVPLLALVLDGFRRVVLWQTGARAYSLVLAGAGVFAFAIHGLFIARGHPEFRPPVSLGLLVAILVVSLIQVIAVLRYRVPTLKTSMSNGLAKPRRAPIPGGGGLPGAGRPSPVSAEQRIPGLEIQRKGMPVDGRSRRPGDGARARR